MGCLVLIYFHENALIAASTIPYYKEDGSELNNRLIMKDNQQNKENRVRPKTIICSIRVRGNSYICLSSTEELMQKEVDVKDK